MYDNVHWRRAYDMYLQEKLKKEEIFMMYAALAGHLQRLNEPSERDREILREINSRLYSEIYRYVYFCAGRKFGNCGGDMFELDDYVDSAWTEIMDSFPKYDGTISLTTFFRCRIESGIRKQYELMHGNAYFRAKARRAGGIFHGVYDNTAAALSAAHPISFEAAGSAVLSSPAWKCVR